MPEAAVQSLFHKRKAPIGMFILVSVGGHLLLLGGLVVVNLFWNRKPAIDLDQKPITASLVRLGKKRDEKLLPRKEEAPPPPQKVDGAEAVPVPVEAAIPVPIPGVDPTEKNQKKQGGEKDSADKRSKLFSALNKAAALRAPSELEGDEQGDPLGDAAIQEGERYYGMLKAQVRRHYDVSNTIPEQERIQLKAVVTISIGQAGELLETKLVKSSANGLYDAAVLAAVKRAAPYSPPPEHLRDAVRGGVPIEFVP